MPIVITYIKINVYNYVAHGLIIFDIIRLAKDTCLLLFTVTGILFALQAY